MLVAGLLVVLALVNLGFWGAERIANRRGLSAYPSRSRSHRPGAEEQSSFT